MSSNLYHREIYMPAGVLALSNVTQALRATEHAKRAALNDRYGVITIPAEITFDGKDIVEAEFVNKKLAKVVVRLSYDARRDAIYVLNIDGTLKTVWFNLKSDKHKTLKKELYMARPSV
jgi:hypothetical protein